MAADPNDIFAQLRTGNPAKEPERVAEQEATLKTPAASDDAFAQLRVPEFYPGPDPDRTLGSEFQAGLAQGMDQMGSMGMGVVGMVGREMDIPWLEEAGNAAALRFQDEAAEHRPSIQRIQEVEDAGDFFKWSASALGQAIPSLATMFASGGVGAVVGKKAVELGVKKSLAKSVERRFKKYGYSTEESLVAARDYMLSDTGKKAIARAAASNRRTGTLIAAKKKRAGTIGLRTGGMLAASIPQIGAIDQELVQAGVINPGLTALFGGVVGGALEFAPALRLMDKLFPGLDRQVSKQFVKDFAVASGTQAAIEGSTEAAQEIIQLAALAYHDPTFDMWSNDAKDRVINAFAAGAIVGTVTGGLAATPDAIRGGAKAAADSAVGRKIKTEAPKIGAWTMDQAEKGARAAGRGVDAVLEKVEPVIGAAAWVAGEAADAGRNKAEEAVAAAKAERGDTQTSFEGEGFTPADNTMFEEIRDRIYGKVQPVIESAVNSLQSQVDDASGQMDLALEGGANPEMQTVAEVAKAAHNQFLKDHGPKIQSLKVWMDEQAARMVATLKTMTDPEARGKYIEDHVAGIQARVAPVVESIKKAAAKRDEKVSAEIDNMDLSDDMLAQMGMEINEEGTVVDQEGEIVDRDEGPLAEVGQPQDEPVLIFGANLATPETKVSGKEEVKGFKTTKFINKKTGKEETSTQEKKEQVALAQLRARYPEADDDTFTLEYQPDGSSIWTAVDTTLKESQKFWRDFDAVRRSGKRPDNPRRVVVTGLDGTKFGYKYKKLELDVKTMAFRGKNLVKDARQTVTEMQGFLAMAGEMLARGIIDKGDFEQLHGAAKILLDTDKKVEVKVDPATGRVKITGEERVSKAPKETAADQRAQSKKGGIAVQYDSEGQALKAMFEAKEEMDHKKVPYPGKEPPLEPTTTKDGRTLPDTRGPWARDKSLLAVENRNGKWVWGWNRSKRRGGKQGQYPSPAETHKKLRAAHPTEMKEADEAFRGIRRDEHMDVEQKESGAFSANVVLGGPSTQARQEPGGQRNMEFRARGDRLGDTSGGDLGDTRGDTAGAPDVEVVGESVVANPNVDQAESGTDPLSKQRDFGDVPELTGGGRSQRERALRALVQERNRVEKEIEGMPKWEEEGDPAWNALQNKYETLDAIQLAIDSELQAGAQTAPSTFQGREGRPTAATLRKTVEETQKSIQQTDLATDPSKLPGEFEEDRGPQLKSEKVAEGKYKVSKTAEDEGRGFTEKDKAKLKRLGGTAGSFTGMVSSKVKPEIQRLISEVGNFVVKSLGLSNQITFIDDTGLAHLIETGRVSDPVFAETLNDPTVHARNIRIGDRSFVYLSDKVLSDPVTTMVALGHELGHHIYRVAWDNLTESAQLNLYNAYQKSRGKRGRYRSKGAAANKIDQADFNEWMADQYAAWLTQRKAPGNPVEAFFAKIAGQVRRLYSFLKGNKRFELNETYAEFARAMEMKARETHDSANPLHQDKLSAWFKNEGVTMHAWFGEGLINKPKSKTPPAEKPFRPHSVTELSDMLNRKEAEIENLLEEEAAGTMTSARQFEARRRLRELEADMESISKDIQKIHSQNAKAAKKPKPKGKPTRRPAEVDDMDFTPITEEGQKALARVERTYPAIASRIVSTRNFMKQAYDLYLAPGAGVMRTLAKQYPSLQPLVMMFHHQALGEAKIDPAVKARYDQAKKDLAKRQRQLRGKNVSPEQFTDWTADVAILKHRIKALEPQLRAKQNYHQAQHFMSRHFTNMYVNVLKNVRQELITRRPHLKKGKDETRQERKALDTLVDEHMRKVAKSLAAKEGNAEATFTPTEQAVRDLFDTMHEYAREKGLPINHIVNYFPRQMNYALLTAGKDKIINHLILRNMKPESARKLYERLLDPKAQDGRATWDAVETPGFIAMNSRTEGILGDAFFDQFRETDLTGIISNYTNQVTKRAEFNERLGERYESRLGDPVDFKKLIKSGQWDPKGKLHQILINTRGVDKAPDDAVVIAERYIDANLGMLGRDSPWASPNARKYMAGMMAYQNMRVLLFTVFASLPDLMGPAIRSNDMKLAWNVMKSHIKEIATDSNKLAETARAYGVIQDGLSEHIMTEYVDNHYMPPTMRKWNDNFFKYTGLNWYTDFTRKYALKVGMAYIEDSYNDSQIKIPGRQSGVPVHEVARLERKKARGKDMLAELGLKPAHVKKWLKEGQPDYNSISHDMDSTERYVAEALIQFVDESIMRPNAAQRPIMSSHPAAMLVFHLKSFMFAVHDVMLKRIKFNIDESKTPGDYMLALAPAIGMMALTAIGLELRELIQYAGSNRKPPTDRMDGWEYTWELAQRSGLTGISQLAIDWDGAADRGQSQVAGISGPTMGQIASILSRPATQTVPKAIPVVGQIPALRDAVRTVM